MAPPGVRHRRSALRALGVFVLTVSGVSARDEPRANRSLELMTTAVSSLETESSEFPGRPELVATSKLLLRYSDPTRGGLDEGAANALLDGGVWRLGPAGRPTALVTVEVYRKPDGSRVLSYEFLSLSTTKFSLKHKTEPIRWDATESALALKVLPGAPKPAGTAAGRLAQMRQLARRFAGQERIKTESIECRLLPQPIDRYESAAGKVVDGAVFAYANGTNPELGVVLEADGERWRYGVVRLTSAEASVTLDGQPVAAFEAFNPEGSTDGSYHNAAHRHRGE